MTNKIKFNSITVIILSSIFFLTNSCSKTNNSLTETEYTTKVEKVKTFANKNGLSVSFDKKITPSNSITLSEFVKIHNSLLSTGKTPRTRGGHQLGYITLKHTDAGGGGGDDGGDNGSGDNGSGDNGSGDNGDSGGGVTFGSNNDGGQSNGWVDYGIVWDQIINFGFQNSNGSNFDPSGINSWTSGFWFSSSWSQTSYNISKEGNGDYLFDYTGTFNYNIFTQGIGTIFQDTFEFIWEYNPDTKNWTLIKIINKKH